MWNVVYVKRLYMYRREYCCGEALVIRRYIQDTTPIVSICWTGRSCKNNKQPQKKNQKKLLGTGRLNEAIGGSTSAASHIGRIRQRKAAKHNGSIVTAEG